METIMHIFASFKSVYLLNGSFVEKADSFKYGASEPLYITVFPLSAHCIPFTVKILNGAALCNGHLCSVYTLEENRYYFIEFATSKGGGGGCSAGFGGIGLLFAGLAAFKYRKK